MKRILASLLLITSCAQAIRINPKPKQDAVNFIKQLIQPGDLVFDVGANFGLKTDIYLAAGARVVCIEPQPFCCSHLYDQYEKNKNVTIASIGLGEQPGILDLSVCSHSPTISTFSKEWQDNSRFTGSLKWDRVISVEIQTLDQLIDQYGVPNFCKIDVENFEYEVLCGLSRTLPCVSVEFNYEMFHNTQKCIQRLADLGFTQFNFALAENARFVLSKWVSADEIITTIKKFTTLSRDEILNTGSIVSERAWGKLLWGDIYARS